MRLVRIGTVRNAIKTRRDVGMVGGPSVVEVLPKYVAAVGGLRPGAHVWVLCWLHRTDRSVLRVVPRKISSALAERGVFATRSPDRPNPVSLTCARLLSTAGRRLSFDQLDVIDGTPVLDLKLYSPGVDCVPNALRPDYARKYALMPDASLKVMLGTVARRRCGRASRGARAAAELALRYIRASGLAPDGRSARLATNLRPDGVEALHGLFSVPASEGIRRVCDRARPWLKVTVGKKSWTVSLVSAPRPLSP
ncbi:MAG: tRNA (N6-threonylcarbamoyladenosine(37)-N6)-methyltransferase TrmO [Elusimicrobia bacterium]|nr:tRNA (N6-threonylcarbamoyladenosine(37)-N6)-methyltransferase TrmO [Elusimicrobiota bacterium]